MAQLGRTGPAMTRTGTRGARLQGDGQRPELEPDEPNDGAASRRRRLGRHRRLSALRASRRLLLAWTVQTQASGEF